MSQSALIPYLGLFGRSGSGKTTLLEKLVREFSRRGYRVAVLKHTRAKNVETDLPGKDSRRLWDAGAAHTAFVASDRIVHTHRYAAEPPIDEALRTIDGVDLILIEGDKTDDFPKIEVVRAACDPHPIPGIAGRVAYVTDVPDLQDAAELPCFGLEEFGALADFIEKRLFCT